MKSGWFPLVMGVLGLFLGLIGAMASAGGFVGALNLTPTELTGLDLVAVGLAILAIALGMDTTLKVEGLLLGEFEQKLAMIWGYAAGVTVPLQFIPPAQVRAYVTNRVLADLRAMKSTGRWTQAMRDEMAPAAEAMVSEMWLRDYDVQEIAERMAKMLRYT